MRRTVLFIAMSLDGYIADQAGGVGWLEGQDHAAETVDFYESFVRDVDTVVMGWNTYHQIVTQLSPSNWVYGDLKSYVITHRPLPSLDGIFFVNTEPDQLIKQLRQEPGKDIWICGGSKTVQPLLAGDWIDRFHISIIPTLLGTGIRLFETLERERKLKLVSVRESNGIVELIYERRA